VARPSTIETFYRDHADAVFAFLISLSHDRARAEDLMQDTFIKASRALGGYRGGNPRAWLFAIARSVFLDDLRRSARRPSSAGPDRLDAASSLTFAATDAEVDLDRRSAIEDTLARLPERLRTALLLSDHAGLSSAEVAAHFHISPGAARVLIHRARQAFRAAYEQDQT
jgi:RNA polymerase sigma-70 factor (ECF subfamily)